MNFLEGKKYCEKIIEPYKEQISDEALAEIRKIYEDYCFDDDPDVVYTNEEPEEIDDRQKLELYDMICWVLHKDGFPVYDDFDEDEDMYDL